MQLCPGTATKEKKKKGAEIGVFSKMYHLQHGAGDFGDFFL